MTTAAKTHGNRPQSLMAQAHKHRVRAEEMCEDIEDLRERVNAREDTHGPDDSMVRAYRIVLCRLEDERHQHIMMARELDARVLRA